MERPSSGSSSMEVVPLDMLPIFSAENHADVLVIQTKEFGNLAMRGAAHGPYLQHLSFGQSCISSGLSAPKPIATLRFAVGHVVSVGADEKVFRVAARRIIAMVTNEHPSWNWSIHESPDDPSCAINGGGSYADDAISVIACCRPRPAGVGATTAINLFPQAIRNWSSGIDSLSHIAPPCVLVRDRRGLRSLGGPVNCSKRGAH